MSHFIDADRSNLHVKSKENYSLVPSSRNGTGEAFVPRVFLLLSSKESLS